jgi:hypothetical protein
MSRWDDSDKWDDIACGMLIAALIGMLVVVSCQLARRLGECDRNHEAMIGGDGR